VVEETVEARAEVVVLVLQALQPDRLLGSFQERLGFLGEREEPLHVPATGRVGLVQGRESFAGELPDRFQHAESSTGPPHEALVDQLLQPVDVSLHLGTALGGEDLAKHSTMLSSASAYASAPSSCSSRVDPSTSVNRKVTVALGSRRRMSG
jgi:hypothetical protein